MDGDALVGGGTLSPYGRGSLQYYARSERTREGDQDQLLLLWRRGGLLEPWGHGLDREHAEVRPQGGYGQDAHADAEQVPLGSQRERAHQRQAPLRHGPERRSEHRDPALSGHRNDLGREP